jgi:fatty acid/phospholipid biosynthesis enzyme
MTQNTIEIDTELLQQREAQVALESDQQILDRMRAKFQILEDMTHAVKSGDVRAMIVSGAPGCLPGGSKVTVRIK